MRIRSCLISAFSFAVTISAQAETWTWQQTTAGNFLWTTTGDWASTTSGTYPNAPGAVADIRSDLSGQQTISLGGGNMTVGALYLGDTVTSGTNFTFSINTGTLTFNSGVANQPALIRIAAGGTGVHNIATPSVMGGSSALRISTTGSNRLDLSGGLVTNGSQLSVDTGLVGFTDANASVTIGSFSGASDVIKTGGGWLKFSGVNNTGSGRIEVRGGGIAVTGYSNATDITVYGNASAGFPVGENIGNAGGGTVFKLGNYSTPINRLNDNAVVTLRGGGFGYTRSNGVYHEVFKELKFAEGNGYLLAADTGTLTMSDMTRSAGATASIRRSGVSSFITVTGTIAGGLTGGGGGDGTQTMSILPWAIGTNSSASNEGTDLITFVSGSIRALAAGEYASTLTTGVATANVNLGASVTVGSGSTLTVNALRVGGGNLTVSAGSQINVTSGALVIASNPSSISGGTLNFGSAEGIIFSVLSNTNTISSTIAGSGGLTKGSTGLLILSGANTFTGTVSVASGILRLGSTTALGVNNSVFLANANNVPLNVTTSGAAPVYTTLDLNGFNQTIGSLNGGGAYGGNVLLGSGTMTLGGNNASGSYSGSIAGTGAIVKTGTGRQTLNGSSTYSGGTLINLGTVLVNNTEGSATGSGAVVVGAADSSNYGTLGGGAGASNGGALISLGSATKQVYAANEVGVIAGAVTVNQYGHLAPGNSVGTSTVGALTLDGGSVLDWEFDVASNDFVDVQILSGSTGLLTFAGITGINLYQEGTTTAFTEAGLYNLFGYDSLAGFSASSLNVLNGVGGYQYNFINNTTDNLIQLQVSAIPEPSVLALVGVGGLMALVRRRRA